MTAQSIERAINTILDVREGGTFTNSPSDKGGPTRWGITMPTLAAYLGRSVTVDDIKNLTRDTARLIYLKLYVFDPGFDHIDSDSVGEFMIDLAVHRGVVGAVKMLQPIVSAFRDGKFGPQTLALTNAKPQRALLEQLIITRANHMIATALAEVPPDLLARTDLNNLKGWINRDLSFMAML